MHAASQLPGGGPLMWMMPLHVNQKSDYDMMLLLVMLHIFKCTSTSTMEANSTKSDQTVHREHSDLVT